MQPAETYLPFGHRVPNHPVQVRGSQRFREDMKRVLDELLEFAPERYYQVIALVPLMELRKDRDADYRDPTGYGRMQGDSSSYPGSYWDAFRAWKWDFLHEVGHAAAQRFRDDWTETKANQWANMVMAELDAAWYRKTW